MPVLADGFPSSALTPRLEPVTHELSNILEELDLESPKQAPGGRGLTERRCTKSWLTLLYADFKFVVLPRN